jgi:hypothetical protein
MGEHRSRIGVGLLTCAAAFVVGGASTAASNAAGWGNPIVIGLLVVGALCLVGVVWALGVLGRRAPGRTHRSQQGDIKAGLGIKAGEDIEAGGTVEAGGEIAAGGNVRAGVHVLPQRGGELSDADSLRITRETAQRMDRMIRDPTLRALDESNKAAAQPEREPPPALAPQFREWLEHEYERGKDEVYKINLGRGEILQAIGPLGHVTTGMKLSALAGSAEQWAKGLRRRLDDEGYTDAAKVAAGSPPSTSGDPTTGDFDRLKRYVEARMNEIQAVLKGAA